VNDFSEFILELSFLFLEIHIRSNPTPPTLEHKVRLKLLAVFWIGDKMGRQRMDVAFGEQSNETRLERPQQQQRRY
jgi:hypothetical protein